MKTSEALEKALGVVTRNWCTNFRHDSNGNSCALGAVEIGLGIPACYGDSKVSDLWHPCLDVLVVTCPTPTCCYPDDNYWRERIVVSYNNGSTHEEVIAWFKKAVARQRAIEQLAEIVPMAPTPQIKPELADA